MVRIGENLTSIIPRKMPMKPSAVQKKLYGSVKVFWLNKELVLQNLKECSKRLIKERKEVEEVRLFGSLAEGRAVPKSDVDLLIITKCPEFGETYRNYFSEIGLPVDLFWCTKEKIKENTFYQTVYQKSKLLAKKN